MSKRVPADGARRRGKLKSRAVAGAQEIRTAEANSDSTDAADPSAGADRPWGHARRAGQQRRRRRADGEWSFHSDLPESVPILPAELIALEAHLGAAIDAILSGRH